jgi:peptide deformylase
MSAEPFHALVVALLAFCPSTSYNVRQLGRRVAHQAYPVGPIRSRPAMAIRKILFADAHLLRQKSQRLKLIDPATQTLVNDMLETLQSANGVGLAAPQVGVLQRIVVIEIPASDEEEEGVDLDRLADKAEARNGPSARPKQYVLINPEIIKRSESEDVADEGCLCLPNYVGEVRRAYSVIVKGKDRRGKDVRVKGRGLLARVLQHEVDHLDGILFMDRVEDPATLRYVPPRKEPNSTSEF